MDDELRRELRSMMEEAGRLALSWFRRAEPSWKSDGTPVTEADRAVEELLVERLTRRFPGESIRSEEGHRVDGRPGAPCWYVDPIDGTGGFVAELAYWGPTVCRIEDDRLHVGAFYVPRLGELWYAERGGGAWRDERRLLPAERAEIRGDDLLFLPSRFHTRGPIPWRGKVRALGSSAAHLAHVAAGSGLATLIPKWSMWDIGCGTLLVREVGREIWGMDGEPVEPERVPPGLPLWFGAPNALRSLFADGVPDLLRRRGER
jgi:myo-inositol-1(or 4)-monophosphatase